MRTPSLRRNPNHLSWNKAIRSISLDIDLMGLIIIKLRPECFSVIYWNFVLFKMRCESHKVQKKIYYVIKSRVSRKRGNELSNGVLTLVRLWNDSMEE
jgi:hypothetical protein